MKKRKIKNEIPKPNYIGKYRHIHGVLRNVDGYMVYSFFNETGGVSYNLTNVKDLPIKPNKYGKRQFNKRWLSELTKSVTTHNYTEPLFMYDIHAENQDLLPISKYTYNKTIKQPHRMSPEGWPYQPYCKDSKRKYQNSIGNKLRTSEQYTESSIGARTRGLLTALVNKDEYIDYDLLFNRFDHKCFNCGCGLVKPNRQSYQIDHMMAASGYWPLNLENTTLLCFDCNQSKTNHHPIHFYGYEKFLELCKITGFNANLVETNYILNDNILNYFDSNFDDIISKWYSLNRNKRSYKKYVKKESKRIKLLDIFNRHTSLIFKLEKYAETL